jgi:hypothetical protein
MRSTFRLFGSRPLPTNPNTCPHVGYQEVDRTWSTRGHIDANDPLQTLDVQYDGEMEVGRLIRPTKLRCAVAALGNR